MMKVTQLDIAKKLGINRVTVSKALKGDADIAMDTKIKVRRLADEMGYIPDHYASTFQSKKTQTIGVIVPDISNSFFSFAIDGVMDIAQKYDYRIILAVSRENSETEAQNIMTFLSMRVDGLLVAVSKNTIDTEIFKKVKKTGTPIVFFDRSIPNMQIKSVGIDDQKTAYELTQYLISKGYDKIAHLGGSLAVAIGKNRLKGYMDCLKENNIEYDDSLFVECGFSKNDGYLGFKELYKRNQDFQAVFAANDRLAQGAYLACKELNLSIPNDVAIGALGHTDFASFLSPELTIMNLDPKLLGAIAIEELVKIIKDPTRKSFKRLNLKTELVVNKSTD